MKSAGILLCALLCLTGAGPIAADDSASSSLIVFGTVEKANTNDADISGKAQAVLSAYATTKGVFHKHHFTSYVLKIDPAMKDMFTSAGFQPLEQMQIHITWNRVSDLRGYGVCMGEPTRTWESGWMFNGAQLEQGLQILANYTTNPLGILGGDQKGYEQIMNAYVRYERGFMVSSSLEARAGNGALIFAASRNSEGCQ